MLVCLAICVVVVAAFLAFKAQHYKAKAKWEAAVSKKHLFDLNAYASTVYALASERWAENETRGEIWVFSVHRAADDPAIRKYSNGSLTVVSLPAVDPWSLAGFQLYADHYNNWNTYKADTLALAGRYDEALLIYRLLERFSYDESTRTAIDNRILIVERLKRGSTSMKQGRDALNALMTKLAPTVFNQIESSAAVSVTNLLEIEAAGDSVAEAKSDAK